MRRHIHHAARALLLAAVLGAVACGGDGDSNLFSRESSESTDTTSETSTGTGGSRDGGHDRDDYVAALGTTGDGLSLEERRCAAAALVDAVGVDSLEAAGSYERIRRNPSGTPHDNGVTLDEAQGAAFYAGFNACTDVRAWFAGLMVGPLMSAEAASCVAGGIDEDTFSRMIVSSFVGDTTMYGDVDFAPGVDRAIAGCPPAGVEP